MFFILCYSPNTSFVTFGPYSGCQPVGSRCRVSIKSFLSDLNLISGSTFFQVAKKGVRCFYEQHWSVTLWDTIDSFKRNRLISTKILPISVKKCNQKKLNDAIRSEFQCEWDLSFQPFLFHWSLLKWEISSLHLTAEWFAIHAIICLNAQLKPQFDKKPPKH